MQQVQAAAQQQKGRQKHRCAKNGRKYAAGKRADNEQRKQACQTLHGGLIVRHGKKAPDAQEKIDQMGECIGKHIARHAEARQEGIKPDDIENIGEGVIAHTGDLLPEPLVHSVHDGIEI